MSDNSAPNVAGTPHRPGIPSSPGYYPSDVFPRFRRSDVPGTPFAVAPTTSGRAAVPCLGAHPAAYPDGVPITPVTTGAPPPPLLLGPPQTSVAFLPAQAATTLGLTAAPSFLGASIGRPDVPAAEAPQPAMSPPQLRFGVPHGSSLPPIEAARNRRVWPTVEGWWERMDAVMCEVYMAGYLDGTRDAPQLSSPPGHDEILETETRRRPRSRSRDRDSQGGTSARS